MTKEFMDSVPEYIDINKNNEMYHQFDTIYKGITIQDMIIYLENDRNFYENRTKEQMEKSLNQFLKDQLTVMKEDSEYYIKNVMPEFLKGEL